jgi:Superinfection immunity protein
MRHAPRPERVIMTLADGSGAGAAAAIFFLFGLALYLIPTIIAVIRKVPNIGSVAVINIFLGWSVVGWVVALAMAARSQPQPTQVQVFQQAPPPGAPSGPPPGPRQ